MARGSLDAADAGAAPAVAAGVPPPVEVKPKLTALLGEPPEVPELDPDPEAVPRSIPAALHPSTKACSAVSIDDWSEGTRPTRQPKQSVS